MTDQRQPKKGLKINNQASSIQKPAPKTPENFEKQAIDAFEKGEDYKARFWDLSVRLKATFEDKTLLENKTAISKDFEKELATKLVLLASEVDDDDNQPNCEGTRSMAMLLLKYMLIQRDNMNALAYKVEKLEKNAQAKEQVK